MRRFLLSAIVLLYLCSLAAAQTTSEVKGSWAILPIFSYEPETEFMFGGLINRTFSINDCERQSTLRPMIIYTQKNQTVVSLDSEFYWDQFVSRSAINYQDFPNLFYGLGNNTSINDKENYTSESLQVLANLQRQMVSGLYAGLRIDYMSHQTTEVDSGGVLDSGLLPGSAKKTLTFGLGLIISWDRRDNTIFPTSGQFYQTSLTQYDLIGHAARFQQYIADLRHYFSVRSGHVLAFQTYAEVNRGHIPFYQLAQMGGTSFRGHYLGRYRDECQFFHIIEYRFPVYKKVGLALFAGLGDVAKDWRNLTMDELKHNYGLGLRYRFDEENSLNIRLDFGFGGDTPGPYIGIGEVF